MMYITTIEIDGHSSVFASPVGEEEGRIVYEIYRSLLKFLKTDAISARMRVLDDGGGWHKPEAGGLQPTVPYKWLPLNDHTIEEDIMTQDEAVAKFMPAIQQDGKVYHKLTCVDARLAVVGERINTITGDGLETTNVAKEGDCVLRNLTTAGELYILSSEKLAARYALLGPAPEVGWQRYKATGSVKAIRYDGEDTSFIATWGENMVLKRGDMIVSTLPKASGVYRIAAKEFSETYG